MRIVEYQEESIPCFRLERPANSKNSMSALGPDCVKTQIADVILRDKFSLFYNSRLRYFELTDYVDTDSILQKTPIYQLLY